jgi:hypothetical protein
MSEIVRIEKEKLIYILKVIDEIIGSLDRISRKYRDDKSALAEKILQYLQERKVAVSLADARKTIISYFSNEIESDDMDEVERILKNQEYWKE